ncbi:unnamed protein product [Chironomus riparius]|uniref:Cuticular protein n=1 Tax=Chironomus riparius TaxID=315576 RepID=A0A9N9S3H1_9DIPT|nr:unnamed protein product [Chironomus riparius]
MNPVKITIALAFIAVVSAGSISYVKRSDHLGSDVGYGSGVAWGGIEGGEGLWNGDVKGDYYAYPKYKFEYGVNDPHTHDHKSQWEIRDGDVVKGEYTLDEADGTKRVVSYTASDKTGFNAVVKKIGHAHHYQPYAQQNAYGGY